MKIKDILGKEKFIILLIFIIAIILRLVYSFSHEVEPSYKIDQIAINIASGNGFRVWTGPIINDDAIWNAPLYPFVVSLIYMVFGHNHSAVLILQAIIGAISCVLIYLIAKQAFNRNVAVISSLLATFCINFIIYSAMFLTETLYISLFLLSFFYLFRAIYWLKKLNYIIAGIFAGLAALTRPIIMIFYIFFFIWGLKKKFLKGTLFFIISLCMVISTWIIRNYLVYNRFIPITATGGEIFWYGNHPKATGEYVMPDEIIEHRGTDEYILYQETSFLEWDSKGYKEGTKFIIQNPTKFFLLAIKKMSLFWSIIRSDGWWPHIKGTFDKIVSVSLTIIFAAFIFTFGIVGMVFSLRDKDSTFKFLLHSFIIVCPLSLIPFFVETRYRLPIYPFMIIFASYGLTLLPVIKSAIKSKEEKTLRYLKISAILIAILLLNTVYDFIINSGEIINRVGMLFQ